MFRVAVVFLDDFVVEGRTFEPPLDVLGDVSGILTEPESGKMCFWGDKRGTTWSHCQHGWNSCGSR